MTNKCKKLSEALGWGNYPNEYSMATLLRMPDIMSKDEIIELSEEEWEVVRQVVEEAIAHLVDFRKQEERRSKKKFNEKNRQHRTFVEIHRTV